jgi:hypothetical protein
MLIIFTVKRKSLIAVFARCMSLTNQTQERKRWGGCRKRRMLMKIKELKEVLSNMDDEYKIVFYLSKGKSLEKVELEMVSEENKECEIIVKYLY